MGLRLLILPVAVLVMLAVSGAASAQAQSSSVTGQAIDACLGGEPTLDAAMSRATAAGWPALITRQLSGREWRTSTAPASDSAPIRLNLMQEGSTLRCLIASAPELHSTFAEAFERLPGDGNVRAFILDNGELLTLDAGRMSVSRSAYIGEARLRHEDGRGTGIAVVLTPML
jgi:hypothetical protein